MIWWGLWLERSCFHKFIKNHPDHAFYKWWEILDKLQIFFGMVNHALEYKALKAPYTNTNLLLQQIYNLRYMCLWNWNRLQVKWQMWNQLYESSHIWFLSEWGKCPTMAFDHCPEVPLFSWSTAASQNNSVFLLCFISEVMFNIFQIPHNQITCPHI